MKPAALPYGRQLIDDADVDAVVTTLRGDWLTQGPAVGAFEEHLAELTGAKYAVAVANGTAALHLACLAAGVRAGDVGVTSTITFVASANCIRYAGGRPVLCDVDPETSLMGLESLRARVETLAAAGTSPKVIIPVDMTGAVADLAAVRAIADSVGAIVIEDAAHSLGATYANGAQRAAGCHDAHMAILSFHPVKHITTAEGGAITTSDEGLRDALRDLRTHGITKDAARLGRNDGPWYYEQQSLGFNYRLSDLQSALGSSQLRKLPRFLERRRSIAKLYGELLAPLAGAIKPLRVPLDCSSAYHLYVVRVHGEGLSTVEIAERRLALFMRLRESQIFAQVHYIPVHTQPDYANNGFGEGRFPGAEAYYAGAISLPMFPAMTDDDVRRVVEVIAKFVEAR